MSGAPTATKRPVPKGLKPFKKGKGAERDPRIWMGGRPSSFDQFRRAVQEFLNQPTSRRTTRLETMLKAMALSNKERRVLLEYAFGKVREAGDELLASTNRAEFDLPADVIAPDFTAVYRDIKAARHTEYLLKGGRGSTKSSFVSLAIIYLMKKYPDLHAVATRQVKDTLRDSVYAQLVWAINELGLNAEWKCTTVPMEMEYLPTGQRIYFRGADDPGKMKSLKPPFGYLGILWFEELDQFHGPESVRKIEQTAIRGGDTAFIFKTFNPPRTSGNWVNKYCQVPKDTQLQHDSNYLTVPREWLGRTFLEEAEHLSRVNPPAYEHEYLGVVNGTGSQVFENVKLRKITDKEVEQFDHVMHGLDWGFYPDPAHYVQCHYDAARLTLYLFREVRKHKLSNRQLYDAVKREGGYRDQDLLIADSAEPKSVADFRAYGASCRGAEKGKDSVMYSVKWLQSLAAIVIDNERCPSAAEEFLDYEYQTTKDGELINDYVDEDNHSIDATRYATNLIWRRRGE